MQSEYGSNNSINECVCTCIHIVSLVKCYSHLSEVDFHLQGYLPITSNCKCKKVSAYEDRSMVLKYVNADYLARIWKQNLFHTKTCESKYSIKRKTHTSSQIFDNFSSLFSCILFLMKLITSWLDIKFHIPSQARTINSSVAGIICNLSTSGSAVIICCVAGRDFTCLYEWSPKTRKLLVYKL